MKVLLKKGGDVVVQGFTGHSFVQIRLYQGGQRATILFASKRLPQHHLHVLVGQAVASILFKQLVDAIPHFNVHQAGSQVQMGCHVRFVKVLKFTGPHQCGQIRKKRMVGIVLLRDKRHFLGTQEKKKDSTQRKKFTSGTASPVGDRRRRQCEQNTVGGGVGVQILRGKEER